MSWGRKLCLFHHCSLSVWKVIGTQLIWINSYAKPVSEVVERTLVWNRKTLDALAYTVCHLVQVIYLQPWFANLLLLSSNSLWVCERWQLYLVFLHLRRSQSRSVIIIANCIHEQYLAMFQAWKMTDLDSWTLGYSLDDNDHGHNSKQWYKALPRARRCSKSVTCHDFI